MKKKSKQPTMDGMIQVTPGNRKSLENKLGFDIPNDVEFILPPKDLQDLLDDPESWEEVKK